MCTFVGEMLEKPSSDYLDLDVIHRWDDEAVVMLYRNFYKALVVFSVQIVGDMKVAEELVQDVFVKLWQKRNTYSSTGKLKAYLYNAVRNESISHMRRQQTERSRLTRMEDDFAEMTDEETDASGAPHREEIYRRLLLAIDSLPAKQREVFLKAIEGKTCEEIAVEMGISLESVWKQRKRGLKRLRQGLKPEELMLLQIFLF